MANRGAPENAIDFEVGQTPEAPVESTEPWTSASHRVLFEPRTAQCDACGGELPNHDEDDYRVAGSGTYVWTRGDEVRIESAPLCASCASAIGMTALARWEIEEEEG